MDNICKQQASVNPVSVFAKPEDVLSVECLTTIEKIVILKRWEYDARELQVAEEENMAGGPEDQLDQVLAALAQLHATGHRCGPTKQGGM